MARTIYCVGGVCGSGKSYFVEKLMNGDGWVEGDYDDSVRMQTSYEPIYYDISTEYADGNIGPDEALDRLSEALDDILQEGGGEDVVLEAFFKPDSEQLARVCDIAAHYDADVVHIWCSAPQQLCLDRIQEDGYKDDWQRNEARRVLTMRSSKWCFHPISTNSQISTYNFINDDY